MLRPILFVTLSRSVRRSLRSFVRVLPAVTDMFLLVLLLLVFTACLGVILFSHVPELRDAFGTVGDALLSLSILLTTSNFPDIMLKGYKLCERAHRAPSGRHGHRLRHSCP